MEEFSLEQTISRLNGLPKEQIKVQNYWAATAFDRFHKNSKAEIEFSLDGFSKRVLLNWDSNFQKGAMREDIDIANQGGVAMAWFVMSVLLDYSYVEQSEIGEGVDYRFTKSEHSDDDLNFLDDSHYVEVSGILEESKTNTLLGRVQVKHKQIAKGSKRDEPSSVIVTLFSAPKTVKEIHR
jgi:hypothetical protein